MGGAVGSFHLTSDPPITFHSFFLFYPLASLFRGVSRTFFSRRGAPNRFNFGVMYSFFCTSVVCETVGLIQSMMLRTDWENELSKGNDFRSEFFFLYYIFFFFFIITMIKNTIEIGFFLIHLMDPHS